MIATFVAQIKLLDSTREVCFAINPEGATNQTTSFEILARPLCDVRELVIGAPLYR